MDNQFNAFRTDRSQLIAPKSILLKTVGLLSLIVAMGTVHAQIQFDSVAGTAGDFISGESYGTAWGDLNTDGWPDIFVNRHRTLSRLHRNNGDGTFSEVARRVDVARLVDEHGMSWADFDNDGDQDLFVSTGPAVVGGGPESANAHVYVNEGGTFVDRSVELGLNDDGGGHFAAWLDYDGDGWLDVLVQKLTGTSIHRQEPPVFATRTFVTGLGCGGGEWAHVIDLTGDGWPELICTDDQTFPDKVYDTTTTPFTDLTGTILPTVANAVDAAVADFNRDQKQDIFVLRGRKRVAGVFQTGANDFEAHLHGIGKEVTFFGGGDPVTFDIRWSAGAAKVFIGATGFNPSNSNNSNGQLFSLSPSDPDVAGIQPHAPDAAGIWIGYDPASQQWSIQVAKGGVPAFLIVTGSDAVTGLNMTGLAAYERPIVPEFLMSTQTGYEKQVITGVNQPVLCASAAAEDFDNDMDIDLYLACRGGAENLPNRLYENLGDGTFQEVLNAGGAAGTVGAYYSEGAGGSSSVVMADYDVDGFVDLFVTNGINLQPFRYGGPNELFHNKGNANHWVELDLEGGVNSNRDAIGAKIYATAGGVTQLREQNGGYHRWSQHYTRIHFGLAGNTVIDELKVEWPSGAVDTFTNVAVDTLYHVAEGGTIDVVSLPAVPTLPPLQPGDECGAPVYDRHLESGVFLWKDCTSDIWKIRAVAGDSVGQVIYSGDVTTDQAFSNVAGFDLEGGDTFDTSDPARIVYKLRVKQPGEDGFDFSVAAGSASCLTLDLPQNASVLLGKKAIPAPLDLDLTTLQSCSGGALPVIQIADVTVGEAAGQAAFTVSLSSASASTVTVEVMSTDGTATAPADYTAVPPTTISFAPGETSKPLPVTIVDDALVEGDETFTLTLSNPTNGVVVDPTATGTIMDDEVVVSPCGKPAYDKATEQGVFVWQDCPGGGWHARMTAGNAAVTYQGNVIADQNFGSVIGFSIEGNDFLDFTTDPSVISYQLGMSGSGQDGFDFTVPAGANVCFGVDAPPSVPVYAGAGRAMLTAPFDLSTLGVCGSVPPAISIADVAVAENDASGVAAFTVSLSAASASTVTVDVTSTDGTATAPADYTAVPPTTISFAPGETSKPLPVTIVDDTLAEGDETFSLNLSNPVNGVVVDPTATGTIMDDEVVVSPCGKPAYDKATEQGVFVWQDCPGGGWHARMTAGNAAVTYQGNVIADQNFGSVIGFSIEGNDFLDFTTDPSVISYQLGMSGSGQDGFDFTVPAGAIVCFGVDAPVGIPVYLGGARTAVAVPFDPLTGNACL
jgi:Calx-beta domain/ASPIC and UnbV/FG-GAP-like repeat